MLLADSGGFVVTGEELVVCPMLGLEKPIVADAASTAANKGDKRISLRSFDTSTHHVYASDRLLIRCPLSIVCC